ncbi:glycoside hydrolase family 3 protein [Cryobacterium melibiosiphilum]|uniref:beta-N-acetylhexosaminidase n=1 Tax=Cryobacterium melibiosiphilum TaxID=995039 RepID=A0A3A5MPW0_9MICO|nr:glycoside hydrolase family 3 N-terminal domain-containing protein [Cryobacterium melibiosiphilum]RJT89178.1 glycoside hydrolase family 3 protein [Cryobacterium melibiosiphilum]
MHAFRRARRSLALLVLLPLALSGCSLVPGPTAVELYAETRLAGMTLSEKVSSLLMLHHPGTDAAALRSFVDIHDLGGLILMGDNVPGSMQQLSTMTAALSAEPGLPLLIGIDQEGGAVSRIPSDVAPGGEALRALPLTATTESFASRGSLLEQAGINVNFGIVADVPAGPGAFLYDRALGTTAESAADRVAAAVAGETGRVQSTLKHFPGHGAAAGDSHVSVPTTGMSYDDWLTDVAPPFTAGIDAGAGLVMFGHLEYGAVDAGPASLSPEWHEILRDELDFDGVIITDDMLMLKHTGLPQYADPVATAIAALAAGNTMLLYVLPQIPAAEGIDIPTLIGALAAAVADGRIDEQLVDDNARRVLELRRSLADPDESGTTGG